MSLGEGAVASVTSGDLAVFDLSRVVTGLALLVSLAAISTVTIRRGFPRAGLAILLPYLAFVLSNFVVPALAGRVPGLDPRLLYAPVVFTAFYFAQPLGAARLAAACKLALGAFLWASLVAAVVLPSQALAEEYSGLIPGLTFRLYGIGGGATSLGAQAAAYLGLEAAAPSRSWTRWLHGAAALTVLVLTQSKTAWAFVLLGALYLLHRGAERRLFGVEPPVGANLLWRWILRTVLGALALALAGTSLVLVSAAAPATAADLQTLTGRTYIWETTVRLWLDAPIFGYGVGLWDADAFRAEYGNFAHAHSQFLQALGSAGLVGLLGLLLYVRAAWVTSRRAAPASPVPLVLLALTLVEFVTEVPLRHPYLLDAHTVLHLLLFAALLQASEDAAAPFRAGRSTA
jgi:O-antigen ligase